jgi:predicted RNA-binding protein with PIN domain
VRRDRWRDKFWIIDGHNAVFALPELHRLQVRGERSAARSALETMLRPFAAQLSHPLTVVYDGNQIERNPDAGVERGIRVLFSQPPDEEADDRIVFLATQTLARGAAVAVVTNDQRSLVARLPQGVHVLGVEEFRDRCLRTRQVARDGESRQVSDHDRREIEQAFLAREDEIMDRARRGARRRERELTQRWQARAGPAAGQAESIPNGTADRGEEQEPAHRWTWAIDAKPAPPAGARTPDRSGQAGEGDQHASSGPSGPPRPAVEETARRESAAAREAREARRRRGQRKQARRLEHMRRPKGRQK